MSKTKNAAVSQGTESEAFGIKSRVVVGIALGFFLVFGIGGWAALANLSGAVIAPGSIIVDANLKAVQHRDGGIIGHIAVREGDEVALGQVLFRLDDAQTRAELSIVRSQHVEQTARRARLIAERDGDEVIEFPNDFHTSHPDAAIAIAGENRLFTGNLTHRQNQKQQLELQITQISEEMAGLEGQRIAKADEFTLVESEYAKLKMLADKGLVEASRMFTVARERWRLPGERASRRLDCARQDAGQRNPSPDPVYPGKRAYGGATRAECCGNQVVRTRAPQNGA